MAIANADGSIVLLTKVDTAGLKKGLSSVTKITAKVGASLFAVGATTAASITKMAVSAYAEFEQLAGGVQKIFDKANIAQIVEDANAAFLDLGMSANAYLRTINDIGATFSATMGDQKGYDTARQGLLAISDYASGTGKNIDILSQKYTMITRSASSYQSIADQFSGILPATSADFLAQAQAAGFLSTQYSKLTEVPIAEYQQAVTQMLSKGVKELGLMGNTAAEAATTISGSAAMMKASWENVLTAIAGGGDLDRAINNLVFSISRYFENIMPVVQRSLLGIGSLIEQIAPLLVQNIASALIQSLPSLLNAINQMIAGLATGIGEGIMALFTGKKKSVVSEVKSGVGSISVSASEASESMNDLGDATEKAGKKAQKSLASFDDLSILASNASASAGGISGLSAGGFGGIGDMPSVDTSVSEDNGQEVSGVGTMLATIMDLLGPALAAVGIILIMHGQIGWGIGFLIAGAAVFAVKKIEEAASKMDKDVEAMLHAIIAVVSGFLLAIGLILLFSGQISPLSIGLVVAGAAGLVRQIAVNGDKVEEGLKGWFGAIFAILSGVFLIIGIIMLFTGHISPLSIGLIVVGAAGLVTELALNWELISQKVTSFFEENKGLIIGSSIVMLVLGIVLLFTGVGLPIALGLIVAGAGLLATTVAINWDFFVEKIKEVWEKIKAYWDENIAPVFTLEWWGDLGKNIINGLIGAIETGLNSIIEKLNTLSWTVPGWVPHIGGETWGFDINEVKIPRLAKGAIIPPNREFLAVLGDQKTGMNVEAPAELIKQMALEAMLEVNATSRIAKEEHYIIGETEIMSVLYRLVKAGERIQGDSFVVGGSF